MRRWANLGIAFLATLAASAAIFYIFSNLIGDDKVALAAAGIFLIATPKIYDELEKLAARKHGSTDVGSAGAVRDLKGFAIPWKAILSLSIILEVGITNVAAACGGLILGLLEILSNADLGPEINSLVVSMAGFIGLPIIAVGFYLGGRWVGSRSSRRGVFVAILGVILGLAVSLGIDYLMLSTTEFSNIYLGYNIFGSEYYGFAAGILGNLILKLVPFLIGYWRGRQMRLAKYVNYLLSVVPIDTRESLVVLAFDEAQKLMSRRHA